jgi:NTE family protein
MMRTPLLRTALCSIAVCGLLPIYGSAQTGTLPPKPRQTIGLVLNGGGALGLAHIGVIRWLEEHHIPIDAVAGTSMGGLVGGAYATGESPAQIADLVKGINWDQMLSDTIPYRDVSYRRKQDARDYPSTLEFGFNKGIRFQEGYKSGQQVQLLLDKIALPYSEIRNFNNLPIPFACVATDLVSGKAKVFREGSLSLAMRATMSLPGIFAPVRVGNAIYADGGLLDNLPVDVAKQMGADITLAVYLQTEPLSPKEHLSSLGVLGHGISVMIAANELKSIQDADVLITIPLQKYTALDYDKVNALIEEGYQAAQGKAALLEKLSVDDATWQAYVRQRNKRKLAVPVPQYIDVAGLDTNEALQIKKDLAPNLRKPLQPDVIAGQLSTIASDQRVSGLSYGLTTNLSGAPGISVSGREDPYGRTIVRPLLLIDGWDYQNVTLSVGARATVLDLGKYGSELRTDGLFGSELLLSSEYYRPLGTAGKWFVAPRLFADNAPLNIYTENGLEAEYRNRTLGGGGDIGYEFNRSSELRVGYELANQKLSLNVGDRLTYGNLSGREGNTHVRYVLDQLDDPITPLKGFRLSTAWEWWDAKPVAGSAFPEVELKTLGFLPVRRTSSIYLGASGGSTLWTNPTVLPDFSLGGSFRVPAYNTNELLTNQYFLFQGGYVYQLGKLSPLAGGRVMLFGGADISKAYYLEHVSHLPSDGSAGIVINTLLGPVVFGAAIGDAGHYKFFFEIGRAYF